MAYLHARAGIARSGVTYCGWTPPAFKVYIDGTDRTSSVLIEESTITLNAESPATFAFTVRNLIPTYGNDVKVAFASPDDYWFAGTLLQIQLRYINPTTFVYDCMATGYEWLIDRYDLVLAEYQSRGVNFIVGDIIARFTNGSFRVGYCPSSLGSLTMEFTYETVMGALKRIAKACAAQLDIAFNRTVNVYLTYPDAAYTTLTSSLIQLETFRSSTDLSQVRTRVLMQGRGSTATANTPLGSTSLPVAETQPFSSAGGTAVSGRNQITYTGLSVVNGAGSLTGVTGISYDIAENDAVDVLATATDAGMNAQLAILLGGGMSGQATHYKQDGRLSLSEATARATADLTAFGNALTNVQFIYRTYVRHLKAGRQIGSISPANGTFIIQSIQIRPYGKMSGTTANFFQQVALGPYAPGMADLL